MRKLQISLVTLALAGFSAGCQANLSQKDEARIQTLEATVKADNVRIDEQAKAIEALSAQKVVAVTPTATATPAVEVAVVPATTPVVSASPAGTPAPGLTPVASATPSTGPKVRDLAGTKATNGETTIWATKVAEYHTTDDLGSLIRVGTAEKGKLADIQASLKSNELKLVVVWLNMTNVSKEQRGLGCSNHLGPLLLRGSEGTQVPSSEENSLFLTQHIEGGFPYESLVPPKGTVSGRVCYIVKDWFVPTLLFPQNDAHLGPHPEELKVSLT